MIWGFFQHNVSLGSIPGHPCLAHDMLPCLQRRAGHFAVHIRPGADDNHIRIVRGDELTPVVVDLRNMKGISSPLGGFPAAVTHTDDLDPFDCLEPRNMPDAGVIPRSNDANLDGLCTHTVPPYPVTGVILLA